MHRDQPLFDALEGPDEVLAAEVAALLAMRLPPECVPGVAANARLIQGHVDLLRGAPRR